MHAHASAPTFAADDKRQGFLCLDIPTTPSPTTSPGGFVIISAGVCLSLKILDVFQMFIGRIIISSLKKKISKAAALKKKG